jgi:DNA-binding phage protein
MEVEAAQTEKALADLSGALRKAFRTSGLTIEAVAEKTQLPIDRVRRCVQAGAYSGSLETLVAVFDAVGVNLHIRLEKK